MSLFYNFPIDMAARGVYTTFYLKSTCMERDRNDGIPFRDPVDGENRKALSFYSLASFPAEQSRPGGCPRYG